MPKLQVYDPTPREEEKITRVKLLDHGNGNVSVVAVNKDGQQIFPGNLFQLQSDGMIWRACHVNPDLGFVLDDKTDLHAEYSFYRAADYQNNISVGMPYGAGAIQNTISAGIVRKLTKNISLSLKYCYVSYSDQTSGYNNNYTANMIYSGLQFKF